LRFATFQVVVDGVCRFGRGQASEDRMRDVVKNWRTISGEDKLK
jgi:hypothetical protein